MFTMKLDRSVLGREYIIQDDTRVVVGGYIHFVKQKQDLKSFEQPAHFYKDEAIEYVNKLNSNPDYVKMVTVC